ncbi:hypothetical protein WN55_01127 [Dufourea novaeangliae]|uniref:Uncharacterized protein n=1 Tax=Dufourea novaeangliae TaxID=178035 RepID=A0A154PFC4_DUFNO|nr:hypothetical protein WN55_01127 [Dufourea novaeangliae]
MRTEGGPSAIRVSCSLNMKDTQRQNSFDFIPKSDYNKKWHLENKCLFHNQQYFEGEKSGIGTSYTKSHFTCNACPRSTDKYKRRTIGSTLSTIDSTLNQKSGDWKYEKNTIEEHCSPGKIVNDPACSDWKKKNLYSISDFEQWHQSTFTYANYQESYGIPRTEYSFASLIKIMGQATGRSLLALLYVMLNIIPVVEVFLYVIRFVLDKVISIRSSRDFRQRMVRFFVFMTELFSVYICLVFIFGFIVMPIVQMVIGITAKIMLCN